MEPGQTLLVHGHEVTYLEPLHERRPGSDVYSARLAVARDGHAVGELRPELKLHDKFPEPEKDVAIHQSAAGDLYAILAQPVDPRGGPAKVQILWNPLVAWVWWSSYLLIAGTLVCAWPDRRERAVAKAVAEERAA
jgi:cytochrome c-type biogenesis protein CcmF